MRDGFENYGVGARVPSGLVRRPEGGRIVEWDPPTEIETETGFVLPIQLDANAAYPAGNPVGVLRAEGRWSHCDFWINVSVAWSPVNFRLTAITGGWMQVLDEKLVSDLENPRVTTGKIEGILLRARGTACDQFLVEAWPLTTRELSGADAGQFRFRCWGHDDSCGADRASRLAVDLYAHPHQTWRFPTAAPVALVVGAPTVIAAANPTGRRSSLREVILSSNDLVPQQVIVRSSGGTRQVALFTMGGGGTETIQIEPPLVSLPGETWIATLTAVSPGASVFIAALGSYE